MVSVCFMILALIITATFRISAVHALFPLVKVLHFQCINRFPEMATSAPELKAIVCGENFLTGNVSEIYIASGLIHLFVVSGAHLLVLEKLFLKVFLAKDNFSVILILSALFGYALACELNPPILRSYISILFSLFLRRNHLYWPENFKVFCVGLLTLLANPEWINSFSLQLSWMAGLVVCMNASYFKNYGVLFKQFLFFIFIWPFLIFLQVPSLCSIITNLIFTPFLEIFLFPLGLIVWILPFLFPVFDTLIRTIKNLLMVFEFQLNLQDHLQATSMVWWGWIFILTVHFCYHQVEMLERQRNYA